MEFLDLLEKVLASATNNAEETDSIPTDGDTTRRRKTTASPSRKVQSEPDYTTEQLQHVKRIQRYSLILCGLFAHFYQVILLLFGSCKDYYEVLKVSKEATDTDIKKSYKKLALVLHPGEFILT